MIMSRMLADHPGAASGWRRLCLGLCVALCVSLAALPSAQAQRGPLGTMHQAFGSCQMGTFVPFAVAFASVPSLVMLIGNAATLGKTSGRSWGITGAVVSGVGMTVESAFLVGVAAQRGTSPCDGTHVALALISMSVHITTASLSATNIVRSERRIIKGLLALREKRKLERLQRRVNREQRRATPLFPVRARPAKRRKVRVACKQIHTLYQSTLNDALTSEDKEQSTPLLDKLEREYGYCFRDSEGQLLVQQRQTILQGIQPRLPRDAPLPSVDQREPPAKRRAVRPRPLSRRSRARPRPRAITRRAPPRRRTQPPKRRAKQAIPDSILNQIAAGKVPVGRSRPRPTRRPARRRPASRRAPRARSVRRRPATRRRPAARRTKGPTRRPKTTPSNTGTPPPGDKTPPRNTWLQLDL